MMDTSLLALARKLSPSNGASADSTMTDNMRQLVQLRWIAVIGQLVTIAFVHWGLGIPLPALAMFAVVGVLAAANLAVTLLLRRNTVSHLEIQLALLFDVGMLSAQLYMSGGATNPFVSLYLLQVVLGAILLERWSVWFLLGVTGLCLALLSVSYLPLTYPAHLRQWQGPLTAAANWIGFMLVGVLLLLFVTRITRILQLRDAHLAEMGQRSMEEDGIVRMGLFASGAAHELGTPLSTVSVILSDWRRMPKIASDSELLAELGEMEEEVQRCKTIVSDILRTAGQPRGEELASIGVDAFLDGLVAAWRHTHASTILEVRRDGTAGVAMIADPALRQAILNLLENAAEASPGWVGMEVVRRQDELVLAVRDRGPGLDAVTLRELGKPRPSRKGPGHGVGLFLVWNVMRRLAGRVEAHNRSEGGAEIVLHLPLAADLQRRDT